MKYSLVVLFAFIACAFGIPNIATWYCSLDGSKGSCFPGGCGTYNDPNPGTGITALNPALFGTGSACSYKGPACGQCWSLQGPAGHRIVTVTDCCAGYPNQPSCLQDPSDPSCDWCAKGDNNHFDLDYDSFVTVCGSAGVQAGHCVLQDAAKVGC
eukprot:Phypoly_transcript_22384.p1 GENE.Phypoly_transcript_22384~~Phypoly_transcript_22384.p1  ORF type:complete len:155 (+),score=23.00 Phypoly_transcript_22384:77-541(+)